MALCLNTDWIEALYDGVFLFPFSFFFLNHPVYEIKIIHALV